MSSILRVLNSTADQWKIPLFLVAFAGIWTVILIVAYCNADLHPDVIEAWTLGQTFEWGGAKHPPLMGWIARSWTFIFPVADWSFQLLAMINSAVALWMIDVLARRFCDQEKRILILLLLLLTPVYQFQAQRFNANSILFATWPLAIYCFMRSFKTCGIGWAAAAGLTAAITLLGKYYSAFLLASFFLAAVVHPERQRYFKSPAPWISILVGIAVLTPHLLWLAADFSPFQYALAVHGGVTAFQSFLSGISFVLGVAGTLVLPAVVGALIVRPRAGNIFRAVRSLDTELKFLLLIGVGTLLLPPVVSLLFKSSLTSLWASPGLFIFVVVAVSVVENPINKVRLRKLELGVFFLTILAFLTSPLHALYRNTHVFSEGRNYFQLATTELMIRWRAITPAPLKTVGGDRLAAAISFYSPDHPKYFPPSNTGLEWQIPSAEILRAGWATMCFEEDQWCIDWLKKAASANLASVSFSFVVQPNFLSQSGVPKKIYAVIVPPNQKVNVQ